MVETESAPVPALSFKNVLEVRVSSEPNREPIPACSAKHEPTLGSELILVTLNERNVDLYGFERLARLDTKAFVDIYTSSIAVA